MSRTSAIETTQVVLSGNLQRAVASVVTMTLALSTTPLSSSGSCLRCRPPKNNLPTKMPHDGLHPIQLDRQASTLAIVEDLRVLC
jgi:hypothetical protein